MSTPWTDRVSTVMPLPEYPRPQMERSSWQNLNGRWGYQVCASPALPPRSGPCPPPFGLALPETILVPFAPQSALSGIDRGDTAGFYRRTFTVPEGWRGEHVLLNFGAVSWHSDVWVNHHFIGLHHGDYSGFSFDITRALRRRGPNELVVAYDNPVGAAGEPVGKQAPGLPAGIHHSAASGIWQTVWLEPVARRHLTDLELTPDVARSRLLVTPSVAGGGHGLRVLVQALAGGKIVASAQGDPGAPISLRIDHPQLWWPWSPYLYDLRVTLLQAGGTWDTVSSYFGMRSITLGRVAGATRVLLNGRFVFQSGALDQGYWPDGIYTPPTDAAMQFDIATAKGFGYNMVRAHAKVEPDRWYLWADRLGLLVWQDIPGASLSLRRRPWPAARAEFRAEMAEIVAQRRSHPSIVSWIPFNEGWGQFDVSGIARQLRELDPGALVDAQSGSANCCAALESAVSDVRDAHLYTGPYAPTPDRRASVIGEYGGVLPFPPAGHAWPGPLVSVGNPAAPWPRDWVAGVIRRQYAMLGQQMRTGGLSAAIFTELDSPEQELGLVTYDRRAYALSPGFMRALNLPLIAGSAGLGGRRSHAVPELPAGTTGFWPLDEGTGSVAVDHSGNGHPLGLAPGASWVHGPHHRPALVLPGSGAAGLSSGPVFDTTGPFTVSAWLRSDVVGQSGSAVTQSGAAGSTFSLGVDTEQSDQGQARPGEAASGVAPPALRTWWTFMAPNSSQCPALSCGDKASLHYGDGRGGVSRGTWHLVTGVSDRATKTISVYVDGLPQDVEHDTELPVSNGPLILGAGTNVYAFGNDSFAGAIASLRIYSRALAPAEVWQLYQSSLASAP